MANRDSDIHSDLSEDQPGFEQLRKDLRELPKLRTQDDFLLRVKNRIEAPAREVSRNPEPISISRWDWMRSRMTVLSSIAALCLVAVVAVTLLRNPATPEALPEIPTPAAVQETDREELSGPAASLPATPVETGREAVGREDVGKQSVLSSEPLLERKQSLPAPAGAQTETGNRPGANRADGAGTGIPAPAKNEHRVSAAASDAAAPSQRRSELREAARAAGKGEASGMKAKTSYEQEYVPIQNKDLIRMRTGAAVRDSASLRDSVEISPSHPR
jgi:hypothetical protein